VEFKKQTNKNKQKIQKPRLLTLENKLLVPRGEVGAGMGEVGDGD